MRSAWVTAYASDGDNNGRPCAWGVEPVGVASVGEAA
jgi:hypothetical protein